MSGLAQRELKIFVSFNAQAVGTLHLKNTQQPGPIKSSLYGSLQTEAQQ